MCLSGKHLARDFHNRDLCGKRNVLVTGKTYYFQAKTQFYSCKVDHSRNNSPSLFQIVDSQYELISQIDTTLKLSNASFCLLSFKDTVVAIKKQLSILCVFVVSYDQEQSNLSASV